MPAAGQGALVATVSRVVKLIALASSPNENEARSAAYLACKNIREHRLVLLAPDDPRLTARSGSWRPPPPPPARPAPPPGRPARPSRGSEPIARAVIIRSNYPGFCTVCGEPYAAGDSIFWLRGTGSSHVICGRPV